MRWLLALAGLIPLLGPLADPPETMLLIFTIYVALYLWHPRPLTGGLAFVVAALAVGMLIEVLAWATNYLRCAAEPAIFHPQLFADLLIGAGFYIGGGVAWLWLFRRFGFSVVEAFVIQGLFGIFLEQRGAAFLAGLASLPTGVLLWAYVFAVYGCMPGIARLLADPGGARPARRPWHYVVALAAALAGSVIGTVLGVSLLRTLDVLPTPQPICERPFW